MAFFNNWHYLTIGATEEKAIAIRRKKKLGLHLFTYSTAAGPNVFSERGLARKLVFSNPFKVHQLKKEPSKKYLSSCQFVLVGSVIKRSGSTPT